VAVCDMALPGRGVCQTCASNGGRRVAKRGEVGSFRLESSRVGVGKEALRRDMGRHGEVYGYGLYEEWWMHVWEEWATELRRRCCNTSSVAST
jgi:hypothetical protein